MAMVEQATGKVEVVGFLSPAEPGQKHKPLPEKQTKAKRAKGVAQVLEHLPSKLKALSSNPSATKKKKECKVSGPALDLPNPTQI
jgi:hypothetical protein